MPNYFDERPEKLEFYKEPRFSIQDPFDKIQEPKLQPVSFEESELKTTPSSDEPI